MSIAEPSMSSIEPVPRVDQDPEKIIFPNNNDSDLTASQGTSSGVRNLLLTRMLNKPFMFSMLATGIVTMITGVISTILHVKQEGQGLNSEDASAPYFIGCQQVIFVGHSIIGLLVLVFFQVKRERAAEQNEELLAKTIGETDKNKQHNSHDVLEKPLKFPKFFPDYFHRATLSDIIQGVLMFVNFASLVISIMGLSSTQYSNTTGFQPMKVKVLSVDIVSIVLHAAFGITACLMLWWPVIRIARRALFACGVIQFIIGTLALEINYREGTRGKLDKPVDNHNLPLYGELSYFIHVGAFDVALSLLTIALCSTMNSSNRLSKLLTRLVTFFAMASVLAIILDLVYCALALVLVNANPPNIRSSTIYANVILSWTSFILKLAALTATAFLQSRPSSHLAVEVYDVNQLTETQTKAFATLIDKFGKTIPGSPSGDTAMSMLKAYSSVQMPGLSCKVLRVYKPSKKVAPITFRHRAVSITSQNAADYYTEKEFQNLDMLHVLPSDRELELETQSIKTLVMGPDDNTKGASKNQLKRLKKKAAAGKKRENIPFPLDNPTTKEEVKKEVEFNEKLMTTEALVLLTNVEDYDLTTSSDTVLNRWLHKTLGGGSFLPPCCRSMVVRMGLLGFHWPFRNATFYCSPTKRPVARSVALLRAVGEWNEKLPKKERCSLILDPRYANDTSERAIDPSGWARVPLPSSHIVDLRPFKGKSLTEYLKAVKYRNQSPTFTKANGEVVETLDFSEENCSEVLRLWKNIAEKRTSDGNTSVLVNPTLDLFETLGDQRMNQAGHRSLLFLRVDDVNIASCVLFRLGDTITSDLQGLDHDLARHYKAYFVMMQETIQIALREGISFVDFGPTTAKPKLDIGCQSIPLVGGIYSANAIMSWSISMFAKNIETNN